MGLYDPRDPNDDSTGHCEKQASNASQRSDRPVPLVKAGTPLTITNLQNGTHK